MNFLPEKIDDYSVSHSQKEPQILQELTRETWQKVVNPRMLSGAFQGRVLSMISKLIQPKNILEIGTWKGASVAAFYHYFKNAIIFCIHSIGCFCYNGL